MSPRAIAVPVVLLSCNVMLVVSTLITDSLNCKVILGVIDTLSALFVGVIILTVGAIKSPVVKLKLVALS